MSALLKGWLTAVLVWLVMLAAGRLGERCAGMLTGLPTVTGPALLWMTLDHGAVYASVSASGAVVATIACALFARVYVWVGRPSGAPSESPMYAHATAIVCRSYARPALLADSGPPRLTPGATCAAPQRF